MNGSLGLNLRSPVVRGLLIGMLLVALFLRLYRLDRIPPGLTHDEADFSHDAIEVYHGARPIYVATAGYQDEPFMHYASALMMSLVGPSYLAVRATSVFFGMLLLILTFVWARMAFGPAVALGAAAWLAVSYWPVSTSRFALQVEPIASIVVLGHVSLWLALGLGRQEAAGRGREVGYWVLFTLCLTASIYAYEASRVTWVLYPAFGVYLLLVHPALFKRAWTQLAIALAVAAVLSLPLLTHPAAWDRAGRLAGPLEALRQGSFTPLLTSVVDVLGMFSLRGDPFVTYNLPGRPILDPITSLLFYGGIALCVWRWRRPAWTFTLLWFVVGIAPSLLTGVHSASLRSVVAKPAVYVMIALAFADLVRWLAGRFHVPARHVLLAGLSIVVAGIGWVTYTDYFVRWAASAETKQAYFSDVFQAIRYLDEHEVECPILLSSPFPTLPHDPYTADVMDTQHDLDIRWVDGRRALVFPDAPCARLVALSRAPLNELLLDRLVVDGSTRVQIEGAGEYFDVLDWEPRGTWESLRRLYGGLPEGADDRFVLPVDFGGSVRLLGYHLEPSAVAPGGGIRVVMLWQVLDPQPLGPVPEGFYGYDAAVFVHLMDGKRRIVTQEDRLDVPAWNWRPGDTFVQIHHLALDPDLAPGPYDVELGVFTRPAMRRLPVALGDGTEQDHILLQPVEVIAP